MTDRMKKMDEIKKMANIFDTLPDDLNLIDTGVISDIGEKIIKTSQSLLSDDDQDGLEKIKAAELNIKYALHYRDGKNLKDTIENLSEWLNDYWTTMSLPLPFSPVSDLNDYRECVEEYIRSILKKKHLAIHAVNENEGWEVYHRKKVILELKLVSRNKKTYLRVTYPRKGGSQSSSAVEVIKKGINRIASLCDK